MTDNSQPPAELIEHLNRRDCVLFGRPHLQIAHRKTEAQMVWTTGWMLESMVEVVR